MTQTLEEEEEEEEIHIYMDSECTGLEKTCKGHLPQPPYNKEELLELDHIAPSS